MIITFSPVRMAQPIAVVRAGDRLLIEGVPVELSRLPPDHPWIESARHEDGVWHVTLRLPHGAGAPPETLFPHPVVVAEDGPVPLPPFEADAEDGDGPA